VHITTNVLNSNPAQTRCTRYNIMWCSLSVTCDRSVILSTNKTDRHDIAEILLKVALSTIKSTKPNESLLSFFILNSCQLLILCTSAVLLLIPNSDRLQQVEDYVRGYAASTKYWPPSTSWDVRGYAASTKYWPPSTSWGLCQRLCCFYQILTAFNQLRIMSEVILLLPNTDCLLQIEDYVKGCSTSTKYGPPSTSWRLYQRLYYFYQILTVFNKLNIMSDNME
jgi:hypothetical protein